MPPARVQLRNLGCHSWRHMIKEYYLGWASRASLLAGLCTSASDGSILSAAVLKSSRHFSWHVGKLSFTVSFIPRTFSCEMGYLSGRLGIAAIGAGEIDLAALTEGWSEDIAEECEAAILQGSLVRGHAE